MKRWPKRLTRLEGKLLPSLGCLTCQGWTGVVLEGEDGPHRPERCPDCGRVVPATMVVQLVGVRVAAL